MSAGVPTARIVVGERLDPKRKTLRIAELAESIDKRGQITPIAVTPEWELLAGERRLEACKLLKIDVLVRVMATAKEQLEALAVEWAENDEREPPTAEMQVRYAKRREALEQAAAAERQAEGRAKGGHAKAAGPDASGPADPEASTSDEGGRAKTRAAAAAGMSRKTYERASAVVDAADADPERFGQLLEEMNSTGKVAAVAAKLERVQEGHDPDSWCTPPWVLEAVHAVDEHISLDPCTNENAKRLGLVKAGVEWTIEDDALQQTSWDVEPGWTVIWYQPPYSDPGPLTERLCKEWDKGGIRRVHALVKLDTSTSWWAALRDRAAFVVLPRKRLAHLVGDKPRKGSDFCSGMLVLARGDRAELLELYAKLRNAYEGKADVYPGAWILEAEPESSRVAPPVNSTWPSPLLHELEQVRLALCEAAHLAEHPPEHPAGAKGEPLDVAVSEALRAVVHAQRLLTYRPMKSSRGSMKPSEPVPPTRKPRRWRMSFSMTTEQYENRTKTVTRREGFEDAQPGDIIEAIRKGQGLKKGQKQERLHDAEIVSVRREPLGDITPEDVEREGFPGMSPEDFVKFYGKPADHVVTRIEFRHLDEPAAPAEG